MNQDDLDESPFVGRRIKRALGAWIGIVLSFIASKVQFAALFEVAIGAGILFFDCFNDEGYEAFFDFSDDIVGDEIADRYGIELLRRQSPVGQFRRGGAGT